MNTQDKKNQMDQRPTETHEEVKKVDATVKDPSHKTEHKAVK